MFIRIFFILTTLFLLQNCSNDKYSPHLLKPKTKKNYQEILFAIDKKHWKSDLGDQIRKSFEVLVKTTPLPFEKQFQIDFVVPNKILKNIKNNNCFVFIDIAKYHPDESAPTIKKNLWSRNQIIIELKFKSFQDAINYFLKRSNELKSIIHEFNLNKISENWSFKNSISSSLDGGSNLQFRAPNGYKLNKKTKDFWWWSNLEIKKDQNGPHEIQRGIVIYQKPYKNQHQFSKESYIKLKDSIGKRFLKGEKKKSFMTTSKNNISQLTDSSFYIKGKYVKLVKGCWRMKNDKMGGPFISYSWLNSLKDTIITAEGYVYAPNFEKQNYLRELEAIIISGI